MIAFPTTVMCFQMQRRPPGAGLRTAEDLLVHDLEGLDVILGGASVDVLAGERWVGLGGERADRGEGRREDGLCAIEQPSGSVVLERTMGCAS